MGKKAKQKAAAVPERSKIIELCVIYVQYLAAYEADFTADHTRDFDFASRSGHIKKGRRAMSKLIGLSPHSKPGAPPLTAIKLRAKARVLAAMYRLRNCEHPNEIEQAYIRFFAGEVADFLAANHEVPS